MGESASRCLNGQVALGALVLYSLFSLGGGGICTCAAPPPHMGGGRTKPKRGENHTIINNHRGVDPPTCERILL